MLFMRGSLQWDIHMGREVTPEQEGGLALPSQDKARGRGGRLLVTAPPAHKNNPGTDGEFTVKHTGQPGTQKHHSILRPSQGTMPQSCLPPSTVPVLISLPDGSWGVIQGDKKTPTGLLLRQRAGLSAT